MITKKQIEAAAAVDDLKSLAVFPLEAFDELAKNMRESDSGEMQVAALFLAELIGRARKYYESLFAVVSVAPEQNCRKMDISSK